MTKILCSAIHIHHERFYDNQPVNIEMGLVICGRRHKDCNYIAELLGFDYFISRASQGFLTTDNRFVDRTEAYWITKEAGQLLHNLHDMSNPTLISEDLWRDNYSEL